MSKEDSVKRNYLPLFMAVGVGVAIGSSATGAGGSVLPFLFILGCPLMMIVMMKGRSGGIGHDSSPDSRGHRGRVPDRDDAPHGRS
ncbi:MAG: hypothetical protein JWL64_1628 [Frankiales bacterium]|nr:hypothetical protein [Frankiales bacterium]